MPHLIILDTETADFMPKSKLTLDDVISLGYFSLDDVPICFQLSYIHDNGTKKNIRDCFGRPPIPISISCSEITNIIQDDIDKLTIKDDGSFTLLKDTPEFKELYNLINSTNNNDIYVVGHNIDFDIDVLLREGLDLRNCKLIDTLQLSKLFDVDSEFNRLHYLLYSKPNILNVVRNLTSSDKISSISKTGNLTPHNALYDVFITNTLLNEYKSLALEMNGVNKDNVLEKLYELTYKPFVIEKIPFGLYKDTNIKNLTDDKLMFVSKTDITEKNYKYSLELEINKRGGYNHLLSKLNDYELKKLLNNPEYFTNLNFKSLVEQAIENRKKPNVNLIVTLGFGKYKDTNIQDIEESYLLWLQKNNSNKETLDKLDRELTRRSISNNLNSSIPEPVKIDAVINSNDLEDFLNS